MTQNRKKVGVLALQGAFEKHLDALDSLNVSAAIVRTADEINDTDGLIIPGGESTAMTKLIREYKLEETLLNYAKSKPVFGTCAGMILLANPNGSDKVFSLGAIDADVVRNGFGRQVHSFSAEVSLDFANDNEFHAVFIRAPRVEKMGKDVKVLASYKDEAVMLRNSNILVSSFHPELTDDNSIHKYFIQEFLN